MGLRRLATAAAVSAALAAVAMPTAATAKSCKPGWKHAVIEGSHKCLKAGQYCSTKSSARAVYRAKGFKCQNRRLKHA